MTVNTNLAEKTKFKINLFDLDNNRFYAQLNDPFVKELTKKILKNYKTIITFSRQFQINQNSFYGWLYRKEFPISVLKKIQEEFEISEKDILSNITAIKSGIYPSKGGNLSKPINPDFPISLNNELVRIIAHLFGDGVVSKGKKGEINASYYNQEKNLINQFSNDIKKLFKTDILISKMNKNTPYIRLPTPIALILLQKIDSFGSKIGRIPLFIMQSNYNLKSEFLRSFFDDEAYVKYNPPHRYIEITLANKNFINDLRKLLADFNITVSKTYHKNQRGFDCYYFYIRGFKNLKLYNQEIGFNHPSKTKKLIQIMNNPGRNSYLHGETKEKIVSLLKQRQMNSNEMAKSLNRKLCTINHFLKILIKEEKIRCLGKKNRYNIYEVT